MNDAQLDQEHAPAVSRSGEQLAAARERAGLAVLDVARQLNLTSRQIAAIEAGEFQLLPGPVFVRGFIRNYARLLQIDPEPLLEIAGHEMGTAEPQVPTEPAFTVDMPMVGKRKLSWQKYAAAALVVVATAVIYTHYRDLPKDHAVSVDAVALAPPQMTVAEPAAPAAPGVAEVAPAPVAAAAPAIAAPAKAEAAPARVEVAPTKAEAAPAKVEPVPVKAARSAEDAAKGAHQASASAAAERPPGARTVGLRFESSSWVEIRDRNGRKIFSQLNAPGTQQTVVGLPPFSLIVGNAAGVRLSYDDQPVDLAPHIKVDVARLTLE